MIHKSILDASKEIQYPNANHCTLCNFVDHDLFEIRKHFKRRHLDKGIEVEGLICLPCGEACHRKTHFHCPWCDSLTSSKIHHTKHMSRKHQANVYVPGQESSDGEEFSIPAEIHYDGFKASSAGASRKPKPKKAEKGKGKGKFKRDGLSRSRVTCDHCGQELWHRNLSVHLERKHGVKRVDGEDMMLPSGAMLPQGQVFFKQLKQSGHTQRVLQEVNFVSAGGGQAECDMGVRATHLNTSGSLDEGFITTVMHSVASLALVTLEGASAGNTLNSTISFSSSARLLDEVKFSARVMQYDTHCAMLVVNAEHKLSAKAIAQCHITRALYMPQTTELAVSAISHAI